MIDSIIDIANSKYLTRFYHKYGIPAEFWIARKEAFPKGTSPTLLYKDSHRGIVAVKICNNPTLPFRSDADMLFKLVRKTILKLKEDLLNIWEGAEFDDINFDRYFPAIEDMTTEQRARLRILNARLALFERQLEKQFDLAEVAYPGHCHWAHLHFILAENDHDYSPDDDNFIFSLKYQNLLPEHGNINYNEDARILDEKGEPEHHCSLYHDLYEYSGLLWEDILRIEKIWVQFRVNFDLDFDIYDEKTGLASCVFYQSE
jgi:hypothetical protein